ncbi:winged helix-turn-helix domain-containing protein [Aliikangiella marina]|uniref:winged helix-turn-helix domain-containing protein n=1 Tax=Aliikangiella marina TaxID=1712262 RepID=UPI00163D74CA|nr:winged helix-turn-helix domain-containing protein [Aliikangiella marina]
MNELIFKAGDLTLDSGKRQVFIAGEEVKLPKLSYRFLETLIKASGNCVTTAELIEQVWDGKTVGDDTITQRASLLRKSLAGTRKDKRPFYETIRGEGYRWLSEVREVSSSDFQKPAIDQQGTKYKMSILIFTLVAIIALIGYWVSAPKLSVQNLNTSLNQMASDDSLNTSDNMFEMLLQRAANYGKEFNSDSNQIAINLYHQASLIQPDNEAVLQGLTLALLHRVSKYNGQTELLKTTDQYTQRLLQTNEQNPYNIWLRGFHFDVTGDITNAMKSYEKALVVAPDSSEVKGSLAYLYVQKGRLHEAMHLNIDTLGSLQEYQLLQIADVLMLSGLSEKARNWYTKAHQLAPNNAFAAVGLAKYYYLSAQLPEAKEVIDNLHQRNVSTADSYLMLGLISIESENYKVAYDAVSMANNLKPESLYISPWYQWLSKLQNPARIAETLTPNLSEDSWPNLWVAGAVSAIAEDNKPLAIERILKAEELGFLDYRFLETSKVFKSLFNETAFVAAINRMKLKAQAEQIKIKNYALPKIDYLMK